MHRSHSSARSPMNMKPFLRQNSGELPPSTQEVTSCAGSDVVRGWSLISSRLAYIPARECRHSQTTMRKYSRHKNVVGHVSASRNDLLRLLTARGRSHDSRENALPPVLAVLSSFARFLPTCTR
ncbi:hypothetical protein ISCGN_000407 [Ixodes scapularis]